MRRFLPPFILTLSIILIAGYAYSAWRLTSTALQRWLLVLPFFLVWSVPVIYWAGGRESMTSVDELVHALSYLCMGWLNFLVLLSLARDVLLALYCKIRLP